MSNCSERMVLVHNDGTYWYPSLVKDRNTGKTTFRVARPGVGSNRKENTTFVDPSDEDQMHDLVLRQGYLVRCRTKSGGANMFGIEKRNIKEVFLDGKSAWAR